MMGNSIFDLENGGSTYTRVNTVNEHGDLYFLLHKNIVDIILLNLEKKTKKLLEGKKDVAESVRKTVTPTCKL